ncbi:hypothetical protein PTTW11_10765 [Pyrenophora teres f. teres]|uniref:DUF3328 domain containing protein n=1 Tax=Pyrenophora teres f. teres TaxID=97479 RepID=A0A6S6WGB1_9PLEO|nr:hypothetical protein PTTW11_10765 [Pyrenophora teres f. teres]
MDYSDNSAKSLTSEFSEHDQSSTSALLPPEVTQCEHDIRPRLNRVSYLLTAILVVIFLIWTSTFTLYHYHSNSVSPFALIDRGNCGHSVEEAKAKGCIFDIMLSAWVPKPCYDQELSESILAANNFTYWNSNVGGQEVSEEDIRKGDFNVLYTHGTYHAQHCLFLWKLQMKAQRSSVRVLDSLSRNQMHIAHCHNVLSIDLSKRHIQRLQSKSGTPINGFKSFLSCSEG